MLVLLYYKLNIIYFKEKNTGEMAGNGKKERK